jgi:hypothetical protein
VRKLAPYLVEIIADPRTLHLAWEHLARHGGSAPGPNQLRSTDLSRRESWDLCRPLGEAIRSGTYRRGPDRVAWIAKGARRGRRPLVLSNIEDRVVERALVSILQPIFDPGFDDRSFGFRPGRSVHEALAQAESLSVLDRRRVWLAEDLQDAFLHVPLKRLLQVVAKALPDEALGDLLERVLAGNKLPGLRQGGPLSPLLLNVYLDHVLDRPWRRDGSRPPLIRVADDLLVLCRTEDEALEARVTLTQLLTPTRMRLKKTDRSTIVVPSAAARIDWLGFSIAQDPAALSFRIGDRAWEHLEARLGQAHEHADAPLRANRIIAGWLGQRGPTLPSEAPLEVCRHIGALAQGQAFEEIPGVDQMMKIWEAAAARWESLRWPDGPPRLAGDVPRGS